VVESWTLSASHPLKSPPPGRHGRRSLLVYPAPRITPVAPTAALGHRVMTPSPGRARKRDGHEAIPARRAATHTHVRRSKRKETKVALMTSIASCIRLHLNALRDHNGDERQEVPEDVGVALACSPRSKFDAARYVLTAVIRRSGALNPRTDDICSS
jgi:hypothetical protein